MKNLIRTLFLLASLTGCSEAKSQIFTDMGAGYDLAGRAIATLSVGYNKSIINVEGEIRPSLTRSVYANNYIGGRLSFNLINPDDAGLSILPGVGYYYNHVSSDKRNLNKYYVGTAIKSIIDVSENGSLFIEALYIHNSAQFTVGIHFHFTNVDKPY